MTNLRLALCQLSSGGDPQDNLTKGLAACSKAAAEAADIAILPEMWQIGYAPCPEDEPGRARWREMAIPSEDRWVSAFRRAASDLNVAILTTFLERWPGSPRNTALLIDRHGRDVLRYAKVHTCDWGMEKALTPGESFEVARLDVEEGSVDVGIMICADREFPESARELMLGGAELILVPNACPMAGERTSQLRSRAFENMTAIATVNYSVPDQDGHSSFFDGMVFEKTGQPNGRPREQLVFEAGDGEDVYLATLDLDALREYRARETMGDAYRKPRAYRRLTSDGQGVPVFGRSDSRGRAAVPDGE
ncbi:MAG: carbon-nitrogen hydrolase family protein [Acidimicrobiales bacterium]